MLKVLVNAERCAVAGYTEICNMTAGKDHRTYDLALAMGVKTERRTVFLDNDQNPDKIMAQLDLLIRLAGEHGQAVGIGHPYPATVEALRRYQTQLRTRTEMVGISRLVH